MKFSLDGLCKKFAFIFSTDYVSNRRKSNGFYLKC